MLRASDGADLGLWNCGLADGGNPFGVRFLKRNGLDLLFLAMYDNPNDHKNQRIAIIDASVLNNRPADGPTPACTVLQQIVIDPAVLSGPHLIVVPKSTLSSWMTEMQRWCPSLKVIQLHGDKDERQRIIDEEFQV